MAGQVLGLPVELVVATATEEGDPKMLPRMTNGGEGILIHDPTIWTEGYLLPLIVVVIDRHASQAFHLVECMDYILPVILEWHAGRYDCD